MQPSRDYLQSFEIKNSLFGLKWSQVTSSLTVNTGTQALPPYYAEIDCALDTNEVKHIVIKSSNQLNYLTVHSNDKYQHTKVELSNKELKEHQITSFKFTKALFDEAEEKTLLIALKKGHIMIFALGKNEIIQSFNFAEGVDPFKKANPDFLIPIDSTLLVVFQDSTVLTYDVMSKQRESNEFHEIIRTIEAKMPAPNYVGSPIRSPKKSLRQRVYSIGTLNFHYIPNPKQGRNPLDYYRFSASTISHAAHVKKTELNGEGNFLGMTTFDGVFALYDLSVNEAVFAYKSLFGGFNHFEVSSDGELLVLAGQDDAVHIYSFVNGVSRRIECFSAFVTRVWFQTPPNGLESYLAEEAKQSTKVRRIIASSLDGSIAFLEFKNSVMNQPTEESNNPTRFGQLLLVQAVASTDEENKEILMNKAQTNKESVGIIILCNNVLIVSSTDGLIVMYRFEDLRVPEMSSPPPLKEVSDSIGKEEIPEEKLGGLNTPSNQTHREKRTFNNAFSPREASPSN